jgi:hypothetical protein
VVNKRGLPARATLLGAFVGLAALSVEAGQPLTGAVDCTIDMDDRVERWRVELDDAVPLASVDGADVPAEYSGAHVRLLLERGGRAATIGRESGRLVLMAGDGRLLAHGRCTLPARA